MARDYALNTTAAKSANSGGKRITEHGKYSGTFKSAWYDRNANGTESVNFLFVSEHGQEAGPLTLYTHNAKGEELPGFATMHAILACLKVRDIKAQPGKVKLWDSAAGAEVDRQKDCYPAMCGKRIGLVLLEEEYAGNDGDIRTSIKIGAPFNADTGQMAAEVLASAPAVELDRYTAWLDKSGRWVKRLKAGTAPRSAPASTGQKPSEFDDDDIPF